jgi:hypothetical protein
MKKTMKTEKWVVVRDTTGGGNRIYHHAVFCDINTQFVPYRRYIKYPLQSPAG